MSITLVLQMVGGGDTEGSVKKNMDKLQSGISLKKCLFKRSI